MKLAASSSSHCSLDDTAAFVAAPESMAYAMLVERVRAFIEAWREKRRYEAARREFARLGPAALRDLAVARGEFDSYWAESHGRARRTRRRIVAL